MFSGKCPKIAFSSLRIFGRGGNYLLGRLVNSLPNPTNSGLSHVTGALLPEVYAAWIGFPEACYGRQLQTQDAMSTELDEICLRAGLRRDRIWLRWNGRRLSLSYGFARCAIKADTISEGLEALKREEVINYIARLFHPDGTAQ